MGAWGTGILSDDTVRDIYDSYIDLFNRGDAPENIRLHLLKVYASSLRDTDEGPLVWLAIAKAQWDCGQLEAEVLAKVQEVVRDGLGLKRWAEQGQRLLERRKAALQQFLAKLESVNVRPRKPRKAIKRNPLFKPGDCLAVRLPDDVWGAILVLQYEPESDDPYKETYGTNLVAALKYRGSNPPSLDEFEKREWLLLNHHGWRNEMVLRFVFALRSRDIRDRLVIVGNIPLRNTDPQHKQCKSYCRWSSVLEAIYEQDRWDRGIRD
jgi:hypothetical protein